MTNNWRHGNWRGLMEECGGFRGGRSLNRSLWGRIHRKLSGRHLRSGWHRSECWELEKRRKIGLLRRILRCSDYGGRNWGQRLGAHFRTKLKSLSEDRLEAGRRTAAKNQPKNSRWRRALEARSFSIGSQLWKLRSYRCGNLLHQHLRCGGNWRCNSGRLKNHARSWSYWNLLYLYLGNCPRSLYGRRLRCRCVLYFRSRHRRRPLLRWWCDHWLVGQLPLSKRWQLKRFRTKPGVPQVEAKRDLPGKVKADGRQVKPQ